jgi:hypothetical protein
MNRSLLWLGASMFLWGLGESMFLLFQPIYLQQLGADPIQIGVILGAVGVRQARSASRMIWSMPGRPGWTNLHSMTAIRFGVGSLRTFQTFAAN